MLTSFIAKPLEFAAVQIPRELTKGMIRNMVHGLLISVFKILF